MIRLIGRGLALALIMIMGASIASAQSAERQVWAYYFGWYTGDSWNDGRLIDRPNAPYDSRDGGTVGAQIDAARSAGIDAFIMSWYGPKNDNLTQQVFNILLDQAGARGFRAAVSLDMGDPGYHNSVDEVIQSLSYLINDRAQHGAYLRYEGKPVIYFWNQGRFSVTDWQRIRSEVDPNRATLWVAEGTSTRFLPTFDGLYLFNTAWSRNPGSTALQYRNATLNAGGNFYSPTVLPGWDESRIDGRNNPTSPQDRASGSFLERSWQGAAGSPANVILIVSWNEYLENSHIEPSQVHGFEALDTLRPLIAAWKAGGSAVHAASDAPVVNPGEASLTANVVLNVRAAADANAQILGRISPGTAYAIRGEQAGWYQIDFNGGAGFVSAQFVSLGAGAGAGLPAGNPTGITLTVTNNVRLRSAPSTAGQVITTLSFNSQFDAVGRNADNTWVQINVNGGSGWVSAQFANLSANIGNLPVTG